MKTFNRLSLKTNVCIKRKLIISSAMTVDEESTARGDTSPYTPNLHAAAVAPADGFFIYSERSSFTPSC